MEQFSIEKNTWSEISGHFTYQANSEFYLPRIFTGFRRSLAQLSPSKTFFLHGILIFNFTKLFDITSDFCFVFLFFIISCTNTVFRTIFKMADLYFFTDLSIFSEGAYCLSFAFLFLINPF